jgi:hypothetical protein
MAQYTIMEPVAHELNNAANSAEHAVSSGAVNAGVGLDRTKEAYADSRDLYIVQSRGYCDGDAWETITPSPIPEARARYLADLYARAGTWQHRAVRVEVQS